MTLDRPRRALTAVAVVEIDGRVERTLSNLEGDAVLLEVNADVDDLVDVRGFLDILGSRFDPSCIGLYKDMVDNDNTYCSSSLPVSISNLEPSRLCSRVLAPNSEAMVFEFLGHCLSNELYISAPSER